VCDRTGIDDGDIRTFFKRDESIPSLFQGIDQSLGFELVHFTSECGNRNGCHLFNSRIQNTEVRIQNEIEIRVYHSKIKQFSRNFNILIVPFWILTTDFRIHVVKAVSV
jgi:hypothetical protein